MKQRLVIVDDHRIFRSGIRALLEIEEDMEVVGEAGDEQELFALLEKASPDQILMDINLKEDCGVRITERVQRQHPGVRVLGLTMHEEGEMIERMIDAGAMGYVFKDSAEDELQEGIRSVAEGRMFYSKRASEELIAYLQRKAPEGMEEGGDVLTEREQEILKLIAREHTDEEIAEALGISSRTVEGHRRNLLRKFDVRNSVGLVRVAMERGLISRGTDNEVLS